MKGIVLIGINAKNDGGAIYALWDEAIERGIPEILDKSYAELKTLLDAFRGKHKPIADMLCADAGITCMRHDANICMRVVNHFTEKKVPILTVHDSMVIRYDQTEALRKAMRDSFGKEFTKIDFEPNLDSTETGEDELKHLEPSDRFTKLKQTKRSDGYKRRFERFVEWKARNK